ncbi:MAG: hypothetical protein ACREMB_14100, partial [Candidatus Rokuibacteriota bacterium]
MTPPVLRSSAWLAAVGFAVSLAVPPAVFAQAQAGPYAAETLKALEQKKKDADATAAATAQAAG